MTTDTAPRPAPPSLLEDPKWAEILAYGAAHPGLCAVHQFHRPRTLTVQHHHIHPLGAGGPQADWNVITLCPTAHYNVHALMHAMHQGRHLRGGHHETRIAQLGYRLWELAGKPGGKLLPAADAVVLDEPAP